MWPVPSLFTSGFTEVMPLVNVEGSILPVDRDVRSGERNGQQLKQSVHRVVKKFYRDADNLSVRLDTHCPNGVPPTNFGSKECKVSDGTGCWAGPWSPCGHFLCDGTTVVCPALHSTASLLSAPTIRHRAPPPGIV